MQIERLVRRDHVFDAGDVGHHRPAAGGHQEGLRGQAFAIDLDRVRIGEGGGGEDFLDPGLAEDSVIDRFEPVELLVLGFDERRPVEAGVDAFPAVTARILEVIGEVAGVD